MQTLRSTYLELETECLANSERRVQIPLLLCQHVQHKADTTVEMDRIFVHVY